MYSKDSKTSMLICETRAIYWLNCNTTKHNLDLVLTNKVYIEVMV